MRFEGQYGAESFCHVRVYHKGERPVVVVTDVPDNKGTNITNWAPRLMQQAAINARVHALDPIFIEHYPARDGLPLTFALVDLSGMRPMWSPLSKAKVEEMTGAAGEFDGEVEDAIGGVK